MRRPVLYLAGLLLATGASLALAGPASAAPKHCHHDTGGTTVVIVQGDDSDSLNGDDLYNDDDMYNNDDNDSWDSSSFDNDDNDFDGINLLSGNSFGLGLLGTGIGH